MESTGMFFVADRLPTTSITSPPIERESAGKPLQLANFQPRSMLHVPETKVPRPRYPVIDIHTHLSVTAKTDNGVGIGEAMKYFAPVEALLPLMDRKNIHVMVNLTGGAGKGLDEAIRKFQQPYPERFVTFTEPWWERTNQPGYSQFQADEIVRSQQAGARPNPEFQFQNENLRRGQDYSNPRRQRYAIQFPSSTRESGELLRRAPMDRCEP